MAPLPEQASVQEQISGERGRRGGKRPATWCLYPAEDASGDVASVVSCLAANTAPRHDARHKTCILTLAAEVLEALVEAPSSTTMQHQVETVELTEQVKLQQIHQHLDDMNLASDALNLAQEDLVSCEEQLQKHVQVWAMTSAGLAETVGPNLIKKATPHYREQQRLDAARQKVARASAAFLKAKDTHLSKRKCERIAANHARLLSDYQNAQAKFDRLRAESPVQSWVLDAITQYFRAEDDSRMQISFSEAAVLACQQRIADAKAQYQGALRSLEVLSEKEHKARGCNV